MSGHIALLLQDGFADANSENFLPLADHDFFPQQSSSATATVYHDFIITSTDLTISSGTTWNFLDGAVWMIGNGGEGGSLYNYGSIIVADTDNAFAIRGNYDATFFGQVIENHGLIQVTGGFDSIPNVGDPWVDGITTGWFLPAVVNAASGRIIVSGYNAHGVYSSDPQASITNDGLIQVTGNQNAMGLLLLNGGWTVNNSGQINVHAAHGWGSYGINLGFSGDTITNSGSITVTADQDTNQTTGIVWAGNEPNGDTVINHGTITAALAIVGESDSGYSSIYNDGTINGDIDPGWGDDTVTNSGTINGNVNLSNGNDVFDSEHGSVNGLVDGGDGSDTAICNRSDAAANLTFTVTDITKTMALPDGTQIINFENFMITGGSGNDSFTTLGGDDTLAGGAGNDALNGGAGDDTLQGGAGDDALNGDSGIDTASYADATGGVTVSLAISGPQAVGLGLGKDTLISIENLTGSNFNDTLHGNSANNTLSGLDGNDTVYLGEGGVDTALGGDGNDTFFLGTSLTAADVINGGDGNDTLWLNGDYTGANAVVFAPTTMVNVENISFVAGHSYSLTFNDANVAAGQTLTVDGRVIGATNTLTFDGSPETDGNLVLLGGAGNDVLTGGAGTDTLVGGAGNDILNGGGGSDTVTYANAVGAVTVDLTLSTAQAIGDGQGSDTLISIENVVGSNFDDTLSGNSSDNILNGGGGNDTVSYANATSAVNVNLLLSTAQNVGGGAGSDMLISIENLTGSNFNDTLHGNGANNVLSGLGGNDTFYMGDGGIDTVLGGDGNDTIYFGAALTAADVIDGGVGTDTLWLNGDYTDANAVVFAPTTMSNVENIGFIAGHSFNLTTGDANVAVGQTLTVNGSTLGATDSLTFDGSQELDGNFILLGGAGNDVLIGGAGNDTLVGGAGNDTLNGSSGIDTASYAIATAGVNVNLSISTAQAVGAGMGNDTLISIENLTGSNFNDVLRDSSADNVLSGGGGNDTFDLSDGGNDIVLGGDGNDVMNFGAALTATDKIDGGAGSDTVTLNGDYSSGITFSASTMVNVETLSLVAGHSYKLTLNNGNLAAGQTMTVTGAALGAGDTFHFDGSHETNGSFVIYGGAGDDVLTGSAGNDTIYGGLGNDTLRGGLGADHMTGGAGNDIFVYKSAAESTGANYDTITGFNFAASDRIDLKFTVGAIDTAVATGALSAASFDTDLAASIDAAHLGKHHAVLYTPDSGDLAGKTFLIVDANGVKGYQAGSDFVIQLDQPSHTTSIDVTAFI